MSRKFPRTVKVTLVAVANGINWTVADKATGYGYAAGTASDKSAARDAAWLQLEAIGLVIDE